MNDDQNGANPPETATPTLGIVETLAHGADPAGKEAVIEIGSISGQRVRLHFGTIEALADFAMAVKGALNQARQNARAAGSELTTASPVSKFAVGRVTGLPGTILTLDPETPNEATFVLDNEMAIGIGKLLVVEAGKRLRIEQAISGGKKLTTPSAPRIIRPGMN